MNTPYLNKTLINIQYIKQLELRKVYKKTITVKS